MSQEGDRFIISFKKVVKVTPNVKYYTQGITKTALRRLARLGGVNRISGIYEESLHKYCYQGCCYIHRTRKEKCGRSYGYSLRILSVDLEGKLLY